MHLVGVCGRGMAPAALVARHLGAVVTGCDRTPEETRQTALVAAGIPVAHEHDVRHLDDDPIVVATGIATDDVPDVAEARRRGVLHHRTDLVAAILRTRPGAGITGSHGKGTVTALTAAALRGSGLDPLALLGVDVPALGGIATTGQGPSVVEVDDSDLTLRSVRTQVAVVTNLDEDHPHLRHSLREASDAVGEFVARARQRVILGRSSRMTVLEEHATTEVWRYGRDFTASARRIDADRTMVTIHGAGGERAIADVRLFGPALALNVALAYATAVSLGAGPDAAAAGLGRIDRLDRRLELVGAAGGVLVYDDFGGKHPVNVREGIRALRSRHPESRVTAVFEPYAPFLPRWGYRYARALDRADEVVAAPSSYVADYPEGPEVDRRWWDACRRPVTVVGNQEEAVRVALERSSPGDVVVFFAQVNTSRRMARLAVSGAGMSLDGLAS
jgi:UDP-N-acetylmuramate--alanine ligase